MTEYDSDEDDWMWINPPKIPTGCDLEMYPYDPIQPDVLKNLEFPSEYPKSPHIPLPSRLPFVSKERVTIQMECELGLPRLLRPRLFKAMVKNFPGGSKFPVDKPVVIEIFDPVAFREPNYSNVESPLHAIHTLMLVTMACYKKAEHLQGVSIPRYYGSFTLVVPDYGEFAVIMREYIDGVRLSDPMAMEGYSIEEKKSLMKKVIEVESALDKCGIALLGGLTPAAFIVSKEKGRVRVVPWHFASSDLDPNGHTFHTPGKLPSVLLRWNSENLFYYSFDWFVDWLWVPWLYQEYGHEYGTITEEQKRLAGGIDEPPSGWATLQKQTGSNTGAIPIFPERFSEFDPTEARKENELQQRNFNTNFIMSGIVQKRS